MGGGHHFSNRSAKYRLNTYGVRHGTSEDQRLSVFRRSAFSARRFQAASQMPGSSSSASLIMRSSSSTAREGQ